MKRCGKTNVQPEPSFSKPEHRGEPAKLTPEELASRVAELRRALQNYALSNDAAMFDLCGCPPRAIDHSYRKWAGHWAEYVNPFLIRYSKAVEAALEGSPVTIKDHFTNLYSELGETVFGIGVLAGFILAGYPKEVIDRAERGLAHAFGLLHSQQEGKP
jgi:hypothetical protein